MRAGIGGEGGVGDVTWLGRLPVDEGTAVSLAAVTDLDPAAVPRQPERPHIGAVHDVSRLQAVFVVLATPKNSQTCNLDA